MRMALLPGDGVGPEVLAGPSELAREISRRRSGLEITGPWPVGATAVPAHGEVLPPETVAACADADSGASFAVRLEADGAPSARIATTASRAVCSLRPCSVRIAPAVDSGTRSNASRMCSVPMSEWPRLSASSAV